MKLKSASDFLKMLEHDCGQVHFYRSDNPGDLTIGWTCLCGSEFRVRVATVKEKKIEAFVGMMETAEGRDILRAILDGVLLVIDEVPAP